MSNMLPLLLAKQPGLAALGVMQGFRRSCYACGPYLAPAPKSIALMYWPPHSLACLSRALGDARLRSLT